MIQKLKSDLKHLFKIMRFLTTNYLSREGIKVKAAEVYFAIYQQLGLGAWWQCRLHGRQYSVLSRQTTTVSHEEGWDESNSINIAESRAGACRASRGRRT